MGEKTCNNYTADKDCSLTAPNFYTGKEAADVRFDRKNRAWQSAPCVARTKGGRIFCTFSGDNSDVGDECPNNYNVLMYSDDNAQTWYENVMVIDHPDSVRMHGPILFYAPDGSLWLFWAQSYIYWDSRGGVWMRKCNNPDADKPEWSQPKRLCHGVLAHPPYVTRKGEMLLPVSIWKNIPRHGFNCLPELEYSCVYVMNDDETVSLRGYADDPDTTFDENAIVEAKDGSLIMIMRDAAAISVSRSSDDGRTWTKPEILMKHTSSRSFLQRFPDGNILLVTNDPAGIKEGMKPEDGRVMMTAFLSEDDMRSFSHKLLLYKEGNVSYPAGMIDKDGRVYVSFDRNRYTDSEMYISSFTEEDIIAGKCVCSGSYAARLMLKADSRSGGQKVYEDGSTYEDGK